MDDVVGWQPRFDVAARAWRELMAASEAGAAEKVDHWRDAFDAARQAQQRLVEAGQWLGGPSTLLAAIGRQYSELAMTAALGWLLRPDGHHGLGRAALDEFGESLGVDVSGPVRIVLEEVRHDTRADLVVYGTGWTLVVEAKTFSSERPHQLARIHDLWEREAAPTFVFLTRLQTEPRSAGASAVHWRNQLWRQVAAAVRAAVAKTDPTVVAGGVHDYLKTLELFHDA
ncbi:hypothetical protein Ait01nite_014830 [Actinoplanes italicus]|uniref:PD-(D/E)XK nuclease superfamily protein n=1 Tax=Actinoplanes italicus TaxID=113567 RepID=A0A2T0KI49_9ACTN|nr:PD-(D/E)XK nuclease family protein [Actinoplanes italicus]PRX22917.1 PD-(D/E)XK nuclease superfamily protein [Actinoplanes italicus]GIE28438.1 hypothetical protein Ait01nite_014830 [Actinoplanes italicus]